MPVEGPAKDTVFKSISGNIGNGTIAARPRLVCRFITRLRNIGGAWLLRSVSLVSGKGRGGVEMDTLRLGGLLVKTSQGGSVRFVPPANTP